MSLCVIVGINPQLPGKTKGKPSLSACEYMNTCSNLTINGCYCRVAKCWHQPLGWIGAESEDGGVGSSHSISNTDFFFLAEPGLRRDAQASHCGGFLCCRAQTLGRTRSIAVQELSSSTACGVFLDQGSNPRPWHWRADA